MEFGKVTPEELEQIDFTLPTDRPETTALLSSLPKNKTTKIYAGCAKWGRKDWVGKIYPKGTKEADFLEHYARFFNAIELNATFYRLPKRAQTEGWAKKVGNDFLFCPKFSDKISHIKRLKDAREITDFFLDSIGGFGANLGPAFLMPHPQMGPKAIDTLRSFLESLPEEAKVVVELRHAGWFNDPIAFENVFQMLEDNAVGAAITDVAGRRDCLHMRLTTPDAFIRFVGNGLHPTDYTRVDNWVDRIQQWMNQGLERVFFFMHQEDEVHSPELCKYAIQRINHVCGTSLPEPVFLPEQPEADTPARKTRKTKV